MSFIRRSARALLGLALLAVVALVAAFVVVLSTATVDERRPADAGEVAKAVGGLRAAADERAQAIGLVHTLAEQGLRTVAVASKPWAAPMPGYALAMSGLEPFANTVDARAPSIQICTCTEADES